MHAAPTATAVCVTGLERQLNETGPNIHSTVLSIVQHPLLLFGVRPINDRWQHVQRHLRLPFERVNVQRRCNASLANGSLYYPQSATMGFIQELCR